MTPENFCYWLQGFFELNKNMHIQSLTEHQVNMIQEHLSLVFKPTLVTPEAVQLQKELTEKIQHWYQHTKMIGDPLRKNAFPPTVTC